MIRPTLAIDIESGGCQPSKHPLIAIGTCLLKPCGSTEKKIFNSILIMLNLNQNV